MRDETKVARFSCFSSYFFFFSDSSDNLIFVNKIK